MMTSRRTPKKTKARIGPGLLGFAMAAAAARQKRLEEEKDKYAESHGGHKVPRRKKAK